MQFDARPGNSRKVSWKRTLLGGPAAASQIEASFHIQVV